VPVVLVEHAPHAHCHTTLLAEVLDWLVCVASAEDEVAFEVGREERVAVLV
jgi:hypothetical protein